MMNADQNNVTTKELRHFGVGVGGIFFLLGSFLQYYGKPVGPWLLGVGIFLVVAGWFGWPGIRPIYSGWMKLAVVLSHYMTRFLLTLLYFLVLVPTAWVARMTGKEFVDKGFDRQESSYWKMRETEQDNPEQCERQF